jgi:two-component system sensor histidine kinase MprB
VVSALQPVVACWSTAELRAVTLTGPDELEAHVPPAVLARVVTELLSNASRYAQGSAVCIDVAIDDTSDNDWVEIRIGDDGPGFAVSDTEELFGKGASTGASTGLGLFTARALLAASGGLITAHHGPAGGAQFRIRVPRHREHSACCGPVVEHAA